MTATARHADHRPRLVARALPRMRAVAVCVAAAGVLPLSGCSDDAPATTAGPAASAGVASPTAPSPTPSETGAPAPGEMRVPATSSGDLSARDLPRPARLGPGWAYVVDPGDAEEGYLGNGTPALARDPGEVVLASVPLGCPRPVRLARPTDVVEVDYALRGRPVIALRMRFADPAAATSFVSARARILRGCVGRSAGAGIGPLVDELAEVEDGVWRSRRTPESDPWVELALADGRDAVLLAAGGDGSALRPGTATDLAAAFRTNDDEGR